MTDFTPDWLALREPADAQARNLPLTRLVATTLASKTALHVLDLATGTGANLRYLAEHLPAQQDWMLVDGDSRLLAEVPSRMRTWAAARRLAIAAEGDRLLIGGGRVSLRLATSGVDLARGLADADIFDGRRLVTASALLDLVSENWLRTLADRCNEVRATVLFALTYDGRIQCSPPEADDETVRKLVNRHQRTDKGFGAALGPTACAAAERCFARLGYRVERAASDWVLEPDARSLQQQLIAGWAEAAFAVAPEQSSAIVNWRTRRFARVDAGRSRIVVGHQDLGAWPDR